MIFFGRLVFASALLLGAARARGAACCGGGGSFPTLLLGDDRAQMGLSGAYSSVIGDAPATGRAVWRAPSDSESVSTTTASGAWLISDRWQLGASLSLVSRARSTLLSAAHSTGLGDLSCTAGFEAWPEYDFSNWRPRGFAYALLVAPTGGDVYTATAPFAVDARGKGLWHGEVGVYLLKSRGPWDASLRAALGHGLTRDLRSTDGTALTIRPGLDATVAFGFGYSPGEGDWRCGLSINPVFEGTSNVASSKLAWNTGLDVSRVIERSWVISLAYTDQTLLGPAHNVSLDRSLALALRYKWER